MPATDSKSRNPIRLLIITRRDDAHTELVSRAMRDRGHEVIVCCGADFPQSNTLSFEYGDDGFACELGSTEQRCRVDDVDVVWYRRVQAPAIGSNVHPDDRVFAKAQALAAARSMQVTIPDAFWVNPVAATTTTELKPLQFRLAAEVGMEQPSMLISNDPQRIREFLARTPDAIYKPLKNHIWRDDAADRTTFTSPVALDRLPSDGVLQATPGIFQAKVAKAFEVRAQFFGATCLAARIETSAIQYGEYDYRLNRHNLPRCEAVDLPASVYFACRQLMARLGLVSGAFDFIVTPEGRWVFLEVNPGGQFLFLESWCPDLLVLDTFCRFLESRNPDFKMPKCVGSNASSQQDANRVIQLPG